MKQVQRSTQRYVVCLDNKGYPSSLEPMKLYRIIPDADAETLDLLRVVDESGEDYLYPVERFAPVKLEATLAKAFANRGRTRLRQPRAKRSPNRARVVDGA